MSKRTSLADAMAQKVAPAAPVTSRPAEPQPTGNIKSLTLRLPKAVHDQLREMAFISRRSQHALVLERLNLLFERHGKPPIAG